MCRRLLLALAAALALRPGFAVAQAREKSAVIGTWRLVSWFSRDSAGGVSYPLGPDAAGQLSYDANGRMSVLMMRQGRPTFASESPRTGTDAEVRAAFEGFIGYFGTYEVNSARGTIVHRVEGSGYPNYVGTRQVRYFELAGDELTLSGAPLRTGAGGGLLWRRVR